MEPSDFLAAEVLHDFGGPLVLVAEGTLAIPSLMLCVSLSCLSFVGFGIIGSHKYKVHVLSTSRWKLVQECCKLWPPQVVDREFGRPLTWGGLPNEGSEYISDYSGCSKIRFSVLLRLFHFFGNVAPLLSKVQGSA